MAIDLFHIGIIGVFLFVILPALLAEQKESKRLAEQEEKHRKRVYEERMWELRRGNGPDDVEL